MLVALRKIVRAIDLHSTRLKRSHGTTGPQLVLLRKIQDLGEVSVGGLATSASLSNGTVTGILDRLEKSGLVQRTRSEVDKRRVLVGLTDAGRALLADAPPVLQERFVERYCTLEEWEQTLILSSLQRVAAMMSAEEIDASAILVDAPISNCARESLGLLPSGTVGSGADAGLD